MISKLAVFLTLVAPFISAGEMETNTVERQRLDQARQWLQQNPPNGRNATERLNWMQPIQKACDQLSTSTYSAYVESWDSSDGQAERIENANPALGYLRSCTLQAIADIGRTRVKKGAAIWLLYNMGYVVKTPTACFGIDLCGRDVEQLATELDFLLVSHEHNDHYSAPLIKAMIAQHKPVVTRWLEGTTVVNQSTNCTFGDVHVSIDIGDHHHGKQNGDDNMLMFEVNCGPPANSAVIYHSGDGNNYRKMTPEEPIDAFIVHVSIGMSVPAVIQHLKPRMTLVSHVLELGHSPTPPRAWRWSYDFAFRHIQNVPEEEAAVLTWGERWLLPETTLQQETSK